MNISYLDFGSASDEVLIFDGNKGISYAELEKRSNAIANYIISMGYGKGEVIAIANSRTVETLCAMIGIMKSGAAYMALDLDFSEDVLTDIVYDSGAICSYDFSAKCKNVPMIDLEFASQNSDISSPKIDIDGSSCAYVIYTSGTTGKRKGVMISHNNLINYVETMVKDFSITPNDSTLILTDLNYDLSYTALYLSLCEKSKIVFVSKECFLDTTKILKEVKKHKTTFLKVTPSIIKKLLYSMNFIEDNALDSLRVIFCGGEKINIEDIKVLHKFLPQCEIVNHYGPTETTIGCCYKRIDFSNGFHQYANMPTVGKAISNNKICIVDSNLNLLAPNQEGELLIIGRGVSELGYIGEHPGYLQYKNERAFLSGDRAMLLESGECVILGRKDNVLKLRGYKVSKSELEFSIKKSGLFKDFVLVCTERIIVFYRGERLTSRQIRKVLLENNPSYLIPDVFIHIQEYPYNNNGKIDTTKLLTLFLDNNQTASEDEYEKRILNIAKKFIYIPQMEEKSLLNFKDEGMDSLSSMSFLIEIEEAFGVRINEGVFSSNPTLGALIECIKKSKIVAAIDEQEIVVVGVDVTVDELCQNELFENYSISHCGIRLPFVGTQLFYYQNSFMMNNVMRYISSRCGNIESVLNAYGYFVGKKCLFRSWLDFEGECVCINNDIKKITIPIINMKNTCEMEKVISKIYYHLSQEDCPKSNYVIICKSSGGYNLVCFIKHFLLKESGLLDFDNILFKYNTVYLENDLLLTKEYIGYVKKVDEDKNNYSEFFRINDNLEKRFFAKTTSIIKSNTFFINLENKIPGSSFFKTKLPLLFASYLATVLDERQIPITIYENRIQGTRFAKLPIDATDYTFFVYDVSEDEQYAIEKLKKLRRQEDGVFFNTWYCAKNGIEAYRNFKIYCNCVFETQSPKDDFSNEFKRIFNKTKESTIEGIGIFALIDSHKKLCKLTISSNCEEARAIIERANNEFQSYLEKALKEE